MGYEIKLIIGEVHSHGREEGRAWLQVWAQIDLCKPGYESKICNLPRQESDGVPVYFYGIDGNTEVTKDPYGQECIAVPIQAVLSALETDRANDPKYRRFHWACDLLASIIKGSPEASVVLYGH